MSEEDRCDPVGVGCPPGPAGVEAARLREQLRIAIKNNEWLVAQVRNLEGEIRRLHRLYGTATPVLVDGPHAAGR